MMTSSINNKNNLKLQEERRSGAPYLLDPLPKRSAPPTRGTLNSSIILMEVKTMPLSLLMCLYMALYLYRICIVFVFFGIFLCFPLSPLPSSTEISSPNRGTLGSSIILCFGPPCSLNSVQQSRTPRGRNVCFLALVRIMA